MLKQNILNLTISISVGSKPIFSPNYGNLYVVFFQSVLYSVIVKNMLKWFHYTDELFCFFSGNVDELHVYVPPLNSFDSNLKFRLEREGSVLAYVGDAQ